MDRDAEDESGGVPGQGGGVPGQSGGVPGQGVPGSAGGLSVPSGPRRRRLVLHVDLNNTVLVSDAVTGQGTVAALDGFLPSVTWGKINKGRWQWLSDRPSLLPPCGDAVSYFSQFGRTPSFTSSSSGRRFRAVLEQHLELLRWPPDAQPDGALSVRGEDGRLYHRVLPSFFQLLLDLGSNGVDFAIVFRTFGTDLPLALRAVSRALREGHPLFHSLPQLEVDEAPGRIRCSRGGVVLTRGQERVSSVGQEDGARGLYRYLSASRGVSGFQDHFDWWASHSFSGAGGKPLWIDPFDPDVQHIFIDDNIRLNDQDTIVHPLVFLEPGGGATRSASSSELYDVSLIQTDLLRAIADPQYFTHKVHECQANYLHNLTHLRVTEGHCRSPEGH